MTGSPRVRESGSSRIFLLEHMMGEFPLGIDRGIPKLRHLGTLQRTVAMHPKKCPHEKDR
jgi:hypothetical protein